MMSEVPVVISKTVQPEIPGLADQHIDPESVHQTNAYILIVCTQSRLTGSSHIEVPCHTGICSDALVQDHP
jgi:hypothetical protein